MREITLTSNSIPNEDIDALSEWLKTYPRLSAGPKVVEFENMLAASVGSKYAVFVNSGSSANLIMLYAAKMMGFLRNNKVVVPALCWATTLSPVMQLGMQPILCDSNMTDLSVSLTDLERIFKESKPSCLMLVSVLGMVPNYEEIVKLCSKYAVVLLEDACESLGSKVRDAYVGTVGLMGSYSFFYSHQLCCIEGGAVVTDDNKTYQMLLMLREHGWTRKSDAKTKNELKEKWNVSDFNDMYTFYVPGFNFRNTEINAFLRTKQLERFSDISAKRDSNYRKYNSVIQNSYWMPPRQFECLVSNLGYPIITPERDRLVQSLRESGIDCRPLISGSMGNQPMFIEAYGGNTVIKNANMFDKFGLYIPNHTELGEEDIEYIAKIVNETINR